MVEVEGQHDRAGIDDDHGCAPAPGLPQGQREHGRFVDRVGAGRNDEVGPFDPGHGDGEGVVEPGHGGPDLSAAACPGEVDRVRPPCGPGKPLEGSLGFEAAPGRPQAGDCSRAEGAGDAAELVAGGSEGFVDGDLSAPDKGLAGAVGVAREAVAEAAPVAEKPAVDGGAHAAFDPDHLAVTGAGDRAAPEAAVGTEGG